MMNVRRAATTGTLREHRKENLCSVIIGSEGTQCGKIVGMAGLITIFGLCNGREQAGYGTYPVAGGIEIMIPFVVSYKAWRKRGRTNLDHVLVQDGLNQFLCISLLVISMNILMFCVVG
jgi:hypothetical protein